MHEYGKLSGVHVALLIYHNGRYTTVLIIPSIKKTGDETRVHELYLSLKLELVTVIVALEIACLNN